jgi:hypothetical protein
MKIKVGSVSASKIRIRIKVMRIRNPSTPYVAYLINLRLKINLQSKKKSQRKTPARYGTRVRYLYVGPFKCSPDKVLVISLSRKTSEELGEFII